MKTRAITIAIGALLTVAASAVFLVPQGPLPLNRQAIISDRNPIALTNRL
jgi:hypothetical protein